MSLTNLQQKQWYYIPQLQLTASLLLVGQGSDLQINDGNRACLSSSLPRDTEQRFLQFAEPKKRQPKTMSSICDMMSQIGNQLGQQPPHVVDRELLNPTGYRLFKRNELEKFLVFMESPIADNV